MHTIKQKIVRGITYIILASSLNAGLITQVYADSTSADPEQTMNTTSTPATATGVESTQSLQSNTADLALPESQSVKDPLQGFNRAMFSFNDAIDKYFLKPIATLYNKILPTPINQGIHNFFNNIGELPIIANDLLQLHFYQFANDTWRLLINTTLGIGGLFDVATRMQLPYYTNDFGLTLATWGYQNSTYLVLPFFGPSTFRDGIGIPVDYFAFSIYPRIHSDRARYELYALGVVDRRAQLLHFQQVFEEASLDKYVFMRNAYMQRRAYQIEENQHRGVADANKT